MESLKEKEKTCQIEEAKRKHEESLLSSGIILKKILFSKDYDEALLRKQFEKYILENEKIFNGREVRNIRKALEERDVTELIDSFIFATFTPFADKYIKTEIGSKIEEDVLL